MSRWAEEWGAARMEPERSGEQIALRLGSCSVALCLSSTRLLPC